MMDALSRIRLRLRLDPVECEVARSKKPFVGGPSVLDIVQDTSRTSDVAMVEKVVLNHWAKLEARTAKDLDFRQPNRADKLLLKGGGIQSAQEPSFYAVRAESPSSKKSLPFATVSFLDQSGKPFILIASHVNFRAAIISAFNSCLDIINLRQSFVDARANARHDLVFGGLNTQPVEVEFDGIAVAGFLRRLSPDYVL